MSQLLDFTPSPDKIRNAVQGMATAAPQAEPGLIGKAWNSLKAVAEGVTRIPGGVADTLSDVARGGDIDVTDAAALQALEERRADRQAYLQKYEGQAFPGVAGAMESMPYSLATMGGSILGGVLAGPAGGMGAAGAVAARGTRTQFMQDMLDAAKQALGRMPTEDEWAAISRAYADDADAYALWEAVPEALTNSLFLKILGPVGKEAFASLGIKSALGRGAAELAATQLEEQTGETVTQWGQGGIEARAGLRAQAPTLGEAFGEQAPTTFWQTLLMHGGGKTARWGFDKLSGISGTRPDGKAGAAAGLRSLVEGRSEIDAMKPKAPGTDLVPVGQPYTVYDAEIVPSPADFMVTPGGRVAGRYAARPPQGAPIMADAGQAFLPEGARALPETPAALPVGTGAIPAGSVATGLGAMATPTEYIGGPVAPPFTERPALPAWTGQAVAGRWPGGLSQLAYGPAGGSTVPTLAASQASPMEESGVGLRQVGIPSATAKENTFVRDASEASGDMVKSGHNTGAFHAAASDDGRGTEAGNEPGRLESGDGRTGSRFADGPGTGDRTSRSLRSPAEAAARRKARVAVPNRDKLPVVYELAEADDVQPSHLPGQGFQRNPRYALENERRYHDEQASRDKVNENAARLDPDLLLDAPDANQGAPVVDREGNVIGGNGRAMSIRQAYDAYPASAARYKAALRAHAERLGLDPSAVAALEKPMLVRRLESAPSRTERQALVSALNEDFIHARDKRADSKSRGDRLSRSALRALADGLRDADSLRAFFDEPASARVVEVLLRDGVIQNTERTAYMGADGLLNPDGKALVEAALRGRVARSYETLAKLPADLVAKLDAAIPHILVAEGVGGPWNITEQVRDAVDLLAAFKGSGEKDPNIWLHQLDMLTGKTPKEGAGPQAIAIFHTFLEQKKAELVKMFAVYAAKAKNSPEGGAMPGMVGSQPKEFAGTLGGGLEASKAESNASSASEPPEKNADRKDYGTPDAPDTVSLSRHFAAALSQGAKYDSIVQARREAGELLGGLVRPATETAKKVDEAIELGVTMAARRMVGDMRARKESDQAIFRALVDLYQRQPTLGVRTSTSIAQQAYSTPAPIAFLASRLAGIAPARSLYEPTAGNGMLLLEASPDRAVVNELNPERAARLRSQGFEVTERDAADYAPSAKVDVVIANPPFGRTRGGDKRAREFTLGSFVTKEVDQAIAARALDALKPEGRAVLIVGGKQGSPESRRLKYRATEQTKFWAWLFDHFDVLDHFGIDGKMYARQGAGYPIDVIVIGGRGKTTGRSFPGAELPRVYHTFESLEELLHERMVDAAERKPGPDRGSAGSLEPGDSQRGIPVQPDGRQAGRNDREFGRTGRSRSADVGGSGERGADRLRGEQESPGAGGQEGTLSTAGKAGAEASLEGNVLSPGKQARQTVLSSESRSGAERRGGRNDAGRVDGRSDAESVPGRREKPAVAAARQEPQQKATTYQTPYRKASSLPSMGTLVPKNMATAVRNAMTALQKRHGDMDAYVARQLDYTPAQLADYFAAEQVDALGLALSNLADGAGFVIGDQTGIGKGRVNAGIIRWAKLHGHIPVFVTMKPELYADMVRDLADIGMDGMTPLPTNSGLSGDKAIPLPGGRTLRTGAKAGHEAVLRDIMENGMGKYDAVFTTYDQLNSVNKQDTFRRRFMMNIAPQAVFILDESHNAGGQGAERRKASDAVSRAQFVRKMLQASPLGAFYSSATYAKRPESMSLYFKTDMRHAVDDINSLAQAINEGGIPMQQVVAATLAESGQYIRRERAFEGAEVQTLSVPVDKARAEKCAEIMRAILNFDEVKQESLKILDDAVAKAGGKALDKKEAGKAGASSINFTAIMHNLIAQSLLAQKVDAVVDAASAAVQRGEKAVITLANTMGSMIQAYAEEHDLTPGDPIDLTFRDMFRHYLESTRQVTIKDSQGRVTEKRPMTDEELGKAGALAYRHALESIETSDFGDLPVSIIDRMLDELRRKGIEAGEITGRTQRIDYSTGTPTYARRKSGPADNIKTVDAFNSGELDVIILNQSGSTGISLHASSTFKDQRRRNMIIAQPELNIDVFMQTLGRVFRTGQVMPPTYQLLFSDLPAEKRPAAVLSKKMGSLNANTTASKDSDTSFKNIPDFLNKYGDKVAMQVMADNPELNRKMGWPITGEMDEEGAIRKVTGRIPLLSVPEQQQVYDMLESEYSDLIAQIEALGGTGLEAKSLPLDARLREEYEIAPGKDVGKDTPFAAPAKLGVYDVKRLGKPWPSEKVKAMVAEAPALDMAGLEQQADAWLEKRRQGMSDKAFNNLADKTLAQRKAVQTTARLFPAGSPVSVSNENALLEGVVVRVYRKGAAENPVALGAWKMDVAVADAAKQLTVTFSQIAKGEEGGVLVKPSARDLDQIYQAFDAGQSDSRETVCIATGNILAAYDKLKRGSVVTFEDHAGNIMPGVLLPRDTEPHLLLGTLDVSLTADQAMEFVKTLSGKATAKTADKLFLLTHSGGAYQFTAPAAKAKGAQYYLNGEVLKAAGQDFVKSGQNMVMRNVPEARARAVLRALEEQGYGFVTDNNQEAAQKLIGQEKPKASFSPGEYLPKVRRGPRPVKASAVRRVADSLGRKAAKAAQTEVVQSFDELPARLREEYGDKARAVEGVYDPAAGKVWLVADNLFTLERAADVWAHEQIVHHGLRGLLGEDERKRLLNRLWLSLGGMGNEGIREIAERYGVNPRGDTAARQQVMEEYLAGMAKKKRGALLSPREESLWRRIVAAVREAWAKLVRVVGGRDTAMGKADVDRLLSALGRYVMIGRPEGVRGEDTAGAPAFASVGEDREAAGRAAWEQVRKDTEAWGRQLDAFSAGRGNKIRGLTVGETPDVLQRLGAKPLPMEMARHNLVKVLTKHGVPLEALRDLPQHLADPLMVFKSATMADAYVVLTEMERNGENLVAAIHFDVEAGRARINDIASIHDRSTVRDMGEKVPGWVWIKNQITAGNLRYYDKTRSSRWFRERAGLQLPSVVNRESYRGIKILTEKDVVKPVPPDTDKPLASLAGAADRAAWEQVRKDTEAWGRQLDEFMSGTGMRSLLTVCRTPDVLKKLGAPDLPMSMTGDNVGKVMSGKPDHNLPADLLKRLPAALAEPVMVFESATSPDSFVILTELKHEGRSVMAAVHLDTIRQRIRVNDIASAYKRGNEAWYLKQIEEGRLLYQDKPKSLAWARTNRLQLPKVRKLPARLSEKRILTEKDVVKPVPPKPEKPLASLAGAADRLAEKIGKPKKRALSGISAGELADNPALAGVLEKIGVTRPTLAEKWANVKDTWKTTLEQGLFDRFASIKAYSETGYKMARMSTGLGSQLRAIMEFGAPVWRDDAMAVEGKGLQEIFDPVAGELDRFLHWMVGRRASRLMEEGRENLLTKRDIAALLDLAEGKTADGKARRAEYEKVFRELAAFKGKVLDFAQAGGIIDPVGRAVWENADYIPFYRVQERMDGVSTRGPRNGKGLTGQNAGIRELRGGMENLGDPLENLLRNFAHLIDAAQKNKAALQVFADLHKAGMAEQLTSERTKAMVQEDSAALADALEAENLLFGLSAEQKQSLLSVFAIRRDVDASRSKDGGVVYARYQGRPYLFKVADPLLYRALTGMNDRGDTSGVMRFGRRIKRVLTTGVTIMPDFMVRNFLRDSVHSWVVEHKSGLKPLTGSLQGLRATLAMDEDTRQLFASGATFMGNGYRLGNDPEAGRLELERMLKKSRMDKEGFFKSLLDDPKKIASALTLAWDKYESLGGASENAVRHEIYARLRKQGYSHLDASFAARDIMDFSMRGEFAFIRTLTDLVPFLGARLTGLHRLGQGALENPRAFAVKGGLVALAAVGLFLANLTRHKDEWDELEDWDKDSYFHFWIDGRHFRLPKPFEVGFLFGTIPERMAEQALTDAPSGVFWGRVFRGIADQLAMDPTPQAVKPILEDIANRDSFRGTPIVGQALAGRLPTEQHTARTTMTARLFADAMDALLSPVFGKSSDTGVDALRSPVRLEHLINGYFGGLGSTVLALSDRVIRWLRDDPALPSARGVEDWPLVGAFYRGDADTTGRTRFEGELYDAMREADELAASLKLLRETGDTEADRRLREEMGERGARMLRERKALNRLRRDFAKFNRMMDAVYRDRTMSSSQKRLRLDELQRKKNELARREWARRRVAVRGG